MEQFVYVASHDLREPLITVAGFATLLLKRYGPSLDAQGVRFLEGVVQGTRNMEVKIDDLLALSRVNRGDPPGLFPLGPAIEAARKCLSGVLKDLSVTFVIQGQLPNVRGDRGQVVQIFQNLFSNSIKYRRLDVLTTVTVRAEEDPACPGMSVISVEDNGIGFDEQHAERIFGVFQRLHTAQQYSGTGIGLAIVKKIVERHRGRVWATSSIGKGSIFNFSLPNS